MPTPPLSEEKMHEALEAYQAFDGNKTQAANHLDISRNAYENRYQKAVEHFKKENIEFPGFVEEGDDNEPIDDIRMRMSDNFTRKFEDTKKRNWFSIKLKEHKPFGLLWFGDPHLDDDGCNWPLLERHIKVAHQEGVYGANIGDTTNRWVGSLMRKYTDQETSRTTADRLAEWFMLESGVSWLVWLLGNHDAWNDGIGFYKRMGAKKIPVIDWRAKFQLEYPGGAVTRIDAAHGRKGSSIYNELHSTLREAIMGDVAHLYVTGHTHNFAMEQLEIPKRNHVCWLLQTRGYKFMDEYALHKNFDEFQRGSAILAIINPQTGEIPHCFEDVEQGADFLKFLRKGK